MARPHMHKRLRWRCWDVLPVGVQILDGARLARHPDADADDDEEGDPDDAAIEPGEIGVNLPVHGRSCPAYHLHMLKNGPAARSGRQDIHAISADRVPA